jgi:predicted ArsR family transcriptional regulator
MATVQEQARALGDPTRHGIFRHVADAAAPVDVAELTAHFGINHNAVRQHLAKLVGAGLLTASTARSRGPGRPRLRYEVAPAVESRWGVVGPYERLSVLLTELARSGDPPVVVGERAGRQARPPGSPGDVVGAVPGDAVVTAYDTVAVLSGAMARLGFEPEVRRRGPHVELVLGVCPFAAAVLVDADTVCSLHLGLARGLIEGTDVSVDGLVVNDPREARCCLRLTIPPSGPASAEPDMHEETSDA